MLLIKNGRLIDPKSGTDRAATDILIRNGRIAAIGDAATTGAVSASGAAYCEAGGDSDGASEQIEVIDAGGYVVAPGLVDIHVHFRDPGYTYKEDITTGAAAAAAGGYTTVVCMANTAPPIDNAETLSELISRESRLPIHVLQCANLTRGMRGEELVDMEALAEAGAVGFTDDGIPVMDEKLLAEGLRRAQLLGLPVSLHEEDATLIGSNGVNAGRVAEAVGVSGAPSIAEEVMIARDGLINADIGAELDIQHVSSGRSVDIIRFLRSIGVRIHAEVTPQHFSLTEDAVLKKGALARVNPPLRTGRDRQALIEGLVDGTLDIIATDHAPHSMEEKSCGIADAPSGMIGLETALALGITNLVCPGHLTLPELLKKMTVNPAALYNLDAGEIRVGAPADIVIFNPDEQWTVTADGFHGKSPNSPFIGETLYGRVKYTVCRGNTVYIDK